MTGSANVLRSVLVFGSRGRLLGLACLLVMTVISACASSDEVKASDPTFQGLDPTVVSEVLANPVAVKKIDEEPAATRDSMAQGIVRNFIVCREFLVAYQDWQRTGLPPRDPSLPEPTNPLDPSNTAWLQEFPQYVATLHSGDPSRLRELLTNQSGCGSWIPASPGDVSGPTIASVVSSGG